MYVWSLARDKNQVRKSSGMQRGSNARPHLIQSCKPTISRRQGAKQKRLRFDSSTKLLVFTTFTGTILKFFHPFACES